VGKITEQTDDEQSVETTDFAEFTHLELLRERQILARLAEQEEQGLLSFFWPPCPNDAYSKELAEIDAELARRKVGIVSR
jgi:hypothetical protein